MSSETKIQLQTPTALLLAMCMASVAGDSALPARCLDGEVLFRCQCLALVVEPQESFEVAREKCSAQGRSLVDIVDQQKQDFIVTNMLTNVNKNGVWLGLKRDSHGVFSWTSGIQGEGHQFQWMPDEPDLAVVGQDCVVMSRPDSWRWKTFWCSVVKYSYICQYDVQCQHPPPELLSTAAIVGIVIGGLVGFLLLMFVVFLVINLVRQQVAAKQVVHMQSPTETRPVEADFEMVPVTESLEPVNYGTDNDLSKTTIDDTQSLLRANVVGESFKEKITPSGSIKVNNIPDEVLKHIRDERAPQSLVRNNSIDDNNLSANTNTGNTPKIFTSPMPNVDEL